MGCHWSIAGKFGWSARISYDCVRQAERDSSQPESMTSAAAEKHREAALVGGDMLSTEVLEVAFRVTTSLTTSEDSLEGTPMSKDDLG